MPYGGDPAGDPKDEVRFLVGDTGSNELLQDAEVEYLLAKYVTPIRAAYQAALGLSAKFTAKADVTIGRASKSYQAQAAGFRELVKSLAARGGDVGSSSGRIGPPVAGGVVGEPRSDGSVVELESVQEWENTGDSGE